MELRQLAYFEAVVRHGGFSRAAEQLNIAQPAVSAQVRRLERELGAALLERTTSRVRLTPAGELVLARARSALAQVEGARADLAELAAGRIDLALCPIHDDLPPAYLGQPLAPESAVLATPPGRYAFAGGVA